MIYVTAVFYSGKALIGYFFLTLTFRKLLGGWFAVSVFLALCPTSFDSEQNNLVLYIKPSENTYSLQEKFTERGLYRPVYLHYIVKYLIWLQRGNIKGGVYEFQEKTNLVNIYLTLSTGKIVQYRVPEGASQNELALKLSKYYPQSKYLKMLSLKKPDYEGELFPDTYALFSEKPEDIVERMRRNFRVKTAHLRPGREDLILASLVQLEGKTVYEQKLISGVFHNRLKKKMKLQSNATIQYFTGKKRVTSQMLQLQNPHNTYLHDGLPPGPIGNPGITALEAAMYPAKHDYLFFVASSRDGHIFSRTFQEHQLAVFRYRQLRESGQFMNR